nr:tetratricopeptide repeat protein [Pyrinomonadaceae bacterium]
NTDESLALCLKAIAILEKLLLQNSANPNYQASRADFYEGIAVILETNPQRRTEAVAAYRNALEIRSQLVEKNPNNADLRQKFAMSYSYLGDTFYELGDNPNAVENYRKCLEILDRLVIQDSKNIQLKQDQAAVRGSLGISLAETGNPFEGIELLKKVLFMFEEKYRSDPTDAMTHFRIGMAQEGLGKAYRTAAANPKISKDERLKNWQNARDWYQKSLEIYTLYRDRTIIPQIVGAEMVDSVTNALAECEKEIDAAKK